MVDLSQPEYPCRPLRSDPRRTQLTDDEITKDSVEAEFRGWEVFRGVDQRWHAQLKNTDKPVTVHDDDLVGLREEIIRYLGKTKDYWRGKEGSTR